jgi:hypothetical protein
MVVMQCTLPVCWQLAGDEAAPAAREIGGAGAPRTKCASNGHTCDNTLGRRPLSVLRSLLPSSWSSSFASCTQPLHHPSNTAISSQHSNNDICWSGNRPANASSSRAGPRPDCGAASRVAPLHPLSASKLAGPASTRTPAAPQPAPNATARLASTQPHLHLWRARASSPRASTWGTGCWSWAWTRASPWQATSTVRGGAGVSSGAASPKRVLCMLCSCARVLRQQLAAGSCHAHHTDTGHACVSASSSSGVARVVSLTAPT